MLGDRPFIYQLFLSDMKALGQPARGFGILTLCPSHASSYLN